MPGVRQAFYMEKKMEKGLGAGQVLQQKMQEKQKVIGIDGCRGGWLVAIHTDGDYFTAFYPGLESLIQEHDDAILVFIDMPMGLSDQQIKRDVDQRLRTILKPFAHNSVFTPPCREALQAGSYREALEINSHITGKGISLQAWNISPKIRELDKLLNTHPHLCRTFYESHPETCFFFMNDRQPFPSNKKTRTGRLARMKALKKYDPGIQRVYLDTLEKFPRKQVQPDDVADALCLCVSAKLASENRLHTLTSEPLTDSHKIPIRIAFHFPVS